MDNKGNDLEFTTAGTPGALRSDQVVGIAEDAARGQDVGPGVSGAVPGAWPDLPIRDGSDWTMDHWVPDLPPGFRLYCPEYVPGAKKLIPRY